MKVLPPLFFFSCARWAQGFAPVGASAGRPYLRVWAGAFRSPLRPSESPVYTAGYAAGIALGVRDSRPPLPAVARTQEGHTCGYGQGLSARPCALRDRLLTRRATRQGGALGVRDSRPPLPAVARPTSPSIHRTTPAAPRLLVLRRWIKIRPRELCVPVSLSQFFRIHIVII